MKKTLLLVLMLIFFYRDSFSQIKDQYSHDVKIKESIIGFLNWYKINKDSIITFPEIVQGLTPDTTISTKNNVLSINMNGVDNYLGNFRRSGYVSESYINNFRNYYNNIADTLIKYPIKNYFGPIPGLEGDMVLYTFEPEEILNHIEKGRFNKINIIYNKALARFKISKSLQLLFVLTKVKEKWLIDYVGYDNSYKYSFGKQ